MSRGRRRGGGVGFAIRTSIANFREKKVKKIKNIELLCFTGTVGKISRKIIVVFNLMCTTRGQQGSNE